MEQFETYINSPLGPLHLCCSNTAITAIEFMNTAPEEKSGTEHFLLQQCGAQLSEYFSGTRTTFDLPLEQPGTPFQQKVWQMLLEIPFGKRLPYQHLSKKHGNVKAIRAIASANGRNNIAIIVPCHRVIGSDQSLTGYAGGLWRKQWLLNHEAKWASGVRELF